MASYIVHVYTDLVGRRSSCSKWFKKCHEVALAMSFIVAAWIYIFLTSQILLNLCKKCSYVWSFRQPYVYDIEYSKVSRFLQKNKVERRASMWSSNFLVEVAAKFGVSMAVPRNEARKSTRKPASCLVLTCAFDAEKKIEKKMNGSIFLRWSIVPYYTLPPYGWIYIYRYWSPHQTKIKNEDLLHGFFLHHFGVNLPPGKLFNCLGRLNHDVFRIILGTVSYFQSFIQCADGSCRGPRRMNFSHPPTTIKEQRLCLMHKFGRLMKR